MKFGSPFSAGWGNPENCLSRLDAVKVGPRVRLTVQARADILAAWYEVLRNSRHCEYVWLEPGEVRTLNVPLEPGYGRQALAVLRCGPVPATMQRAARWFDGQTSRRASHWWTWTPEVMGSVDSAGATVLSSWNLPGVRYAQTNRVAGQQTRGTLRVELTVSGSAVTVDLYRGSVLMSSGSGTVGGSVTLAGDLDGSVTVGAGAVTSTETLSVRWPWSMTIKRGVSDPPGTTVARVAFQGADGMTWTEPDDLAAGVYYYRFAPVSDTGEEGADSATVPITIAAAPNPPTALAYSSGNAAACSLSFTQSTTGGVTYNVYLQQPTDAVMSETPCAATVGAGTITLPAITGYPGTARVLVRAVLGGVEERAGAALALEFNAAGAYVAPRPNAPSIVRYAVTAGRTLAVKGAYPVADELSAGVSLALYVKSGGSWPGTPDATAALGATWNDAKETTLSFTLPGNGWYRIRVYARNAAGVESAAFAEQSVFVSNADPATVQPDGYNSRG